MSEINVDELLAEAVLDQAVEQSQDNTLPFNLYSARHALQPQPPIDWVVENLFAPGSVCLLTGEPGVGKTWAMLHCGVSVAIGQAWLGFKTRQCAVLWIDEESGLLRMHQRLAAVLHGLEAGPETPFYFTSLAGFCLFGQSLDKNLDLLRLAVKATDARLVVLDALVDLLRGGDENSVKDVQPAFHGLRCLAEETSSTIALIHHSGKAANSHYRGSSAIHGAVDLLLKVEREENSSLLQFAVQKARDVERHKFAAEATFMPGEFFLELTSLPSAKPHFSKAEEYVLEFLRAHGPSPITDITAHADRCSDAAARRAVYSLAQRGHVRRVDSGGPGVRAIYNLCEGKDDLDAGL